MAKYSIFLDESYDDAADVYVVGGVIIESNRVAALSEAVKNVSLDLVGDKQAELKYTEDPAVKALLARHDKTVGDAREAMAAVSETVGGVTLVASIVLDPTVDSKAGSLKPLSWAFIRSVSHFTNYLHDVGAITDPGSHLVMADRFPNKKHQTAFHVAYQEAFERVPHGWSPKVMGLHDFITEGDATHCAPLRLADFFAGTVRAWAMAERRYDDNPGPRTGKDTGRTRFAVNRYLPHIRGKQYRPDQVSGFGLAIWPEERRPQLDLWIAHTRGRRHDVIYRAPTAEVKPDEDGRVVVHVDWGTKRSWE